MGGNPIPPYTEFDLMGTDSPLEYAKMTGNKEAVDRYYAEERKRMQKRLARKQAFEDWALRRSASGNPTPSDLTAEFKRLNSNHVGKLVKTPTGEGQVVGNSFGRVMVKDATGKVISHKAEDIIGQKFTVDEVKAILKNKAMSALASKVGSVANALMLGQTVAQAGYGVGRLLGQTPLISDPNMTYDQFYQNLFRKKVFNDNTSR